jgi:hypothetical protein
MPPAEVPEEISVARLVDDARQQIIDARDRNEKPTYLLVHPRVYDVVATAKARETRAGRPLGLLGLLLLSSNTTRLDAPEVR